MMHNGPLRGRRRVSVDVAWNRGLGCIVATGRFIKTLGRRWILGKFVCWATRAMHKLTTTVWALATEHILGTRRTECALKRTDSRFSRLWREVLVAALTVWT